MQFIQFHFYPMFLLLVLGCYLRDVLHVAIEIYVSFFDHGLQVQDPMEQWFGPEWSDCVQ